MNNYEVLGVIGTGSFGAVTKVRRKSDSRFLVWKEINYGRMSEREKQQLVTEVNILRELNHPNIVKYYDRILDKANTKIYIVMEFCEGGDLGKVIKKAKKEKELLAEDLIWRIFMQLILALLECHIRKEGKILHRDIKPGNIFLDASHNVKLGDFGLSKIMGAASEYATTHVGTPFYMSPEQITEGRYNEKSDIWSLGCLLYEMTTLSPPFEATSHLSLAMKIRAGKFDRIPPQYSEELMRVITWMLAIDPNSRPNAGDLLSVPQCSARMREKRLRENSVILKKKEEEVKVLEAEVARLESEVQEAGAHQHSPASQGGEVELALEDQQIEVSFVDAPVITAPRRSDAHRSISPMLRSVKANPKPVNRHGSLEMGNKENAQMTEPRKSGGFLVTGGKVVPRLPLTRVNK